MDGEMGQQGEHQKAVCSLSRLAGMEIAGWRLVLQKLAAKTADGDGCSSASVGEWRVWEKTRQDMEQSAEQTLGAWAGANWVDWVAAAGHNGWARAQAARKPIFPSL